MATLTITLKTNRKPFPGERSQYIEWPQLIRTAAETLYINFIMQTAMF